VEVITKDVLYGHKVLSAPPNPQVPSFRPPPNSTITPYHHHQQLVSSLGDNYVYDKYHDFKYSTLPVTVAAG
jgi:hypothetical protein